MQVTHVCHLYHCFWVIKEAYMRKLRRESRRRGSAFNGNVTPLSWTVCIYSFTSRRQPLTKQFMSEFSPCVNLGKKTAHQGKHLHLPTISDFATLLLFWKCVHFPHIQAQFEKLTVSYILQPTKHVSFHYLFPNIQFLDIFQDLE